MPQQRPGIWVGHVALHTGDLAGSEAFMKDIGMRGVFRGDDVAVLELRGGTHLVLVRDTGATTGDVDFDLMVEDLDTTYQTFRARGYPVTEVERGRIHDSFRVTEPGGNRITVNSTHVADHGAV